jgi:hypothetical protein
MKNLGFLLVLALMFSCSGLGEAEREKINSSCSIDSIEDLPWVDLSIKENPDWCHVVVVYEGKYDGKIVVIPVVSGALCCTCAGNAVYDCKGELLFVCEPDKEKEITDKKIIWERK